MKKNSLKEEKQLNHAQKDTSNFIKKDQGNQTIILRGFKLIFKHITMRSILIIIH